MKKKKLHRFRIYIREKGKMKGSQGSSYTTLALTKNFGGLLIGFWEQKGAGFSEFESFYIYYREGKREKRGLERTVDRLGRKRNFCARKFQEEWGNLYKIKGEIGSL